MGVSVPLSDHRLPGSPSVYLCVYIAPITRASARPDKQAVSCGEKREKLLVTDAVNYRFVTPRHSLKWHMVAFNACAHVHGFEDIPPQSQHDINHNHYTT